MKTPRTLALSICSTLLFFAGMASAENINLTQVFPNKVHPYTLITLGGSGFSTDQDVVLVPIRGGQPVKATVRQITADSIVISAPEAEPGTYWLSVQGGRNAKSNAMLVKILRPKIVTVKNYRHLKAGEVVEIAGKGFGTQRSGTVALKWLVGGDDPVEAKVESWTDEVILARLPDVHPGVYQLQVGPTDNTVNSFVTVQ